MIFPFKRKREKENLINKPVYITDTSVDSPHYFVINDYPIEFTSGKNAIRLLGSKNLKPGSEILVEVLDGEGNPIYAEINNFTDQHSNFIISIFVYDTTTSGIGSVTLLGKALSDGNGLAIPRSWQNEYNVKWTRQVTISPNKRNGSEILIDRPPLATINLITIPYYETVAVTSSISYTTTQEYTQLIFQGLNFVGGDSTEYTYDIPTQKQIYNPREGFSRVNLTTALAPVSKTTNTVDGTVYKKIKDIFNGHQIQDLAAYNNIIIIPTNSINLLLDSVGTTVPYTGGFVDVMIGGQFQGYNWGTRFPPTSSTYMTITGGDVYNSTIVDVVDSNRAVLSDPYIATYNTTTQAGVYSEVKHRYKQFTEGTASIIHNTPLSFVTSSLISQSLLYFTINNLDPLSGDIYRIKTYVKESGRIGEYQIVDDSKVGATEILVDNDSFNDKPYVDTQFKWYGNMVTSNVYDYWRLYEDNGSGLATLILSSSYQNYSSSIPQLNSFILDKEYYEDLTSTNIDSLVLGSKSLEFFREKQVYRLTFKVTADFETGGTSVDNCNLEIYMTSTQPYVVGLPTTPAFIPSYNMDKTSQKGLLSRYGKLLGSIKSKKGVGRYKPYNRISFEFMADSDGVGRLLFRVKEGAFHISEVHITPATYNGFTPTYMTYTVPLTVGDNTSWGITSPSQSLDFKIEYFDYQGRQSDYITYLPNIRIDELFTIPNFGCAVDIITQQGQWPNWNSDERLRTFNNFERITGSGFSIFGPPPAISLYPGGYPDDGINNLTALANLFAAVDLGQSPGYPQYFGWNYQRYSGSYYTGSFGKVLTGQDFGATGFGFVLINIGYPFTSGWNHSSSWIEGSSSLGSCACINVAHASESWRRFTSHSAIGNFNQAIANTYLKQSRLYWPATTGSVVANRNQYTPFDTNGGIYKVRFKIVQPVATGGTVAAIKLSSPLPASRGSFTSSIGGILNVYIYDVGSGQLGAPNVSQLAPGIASWYPPASLIQTINYDDIVGSLPLTSSYLQIEDMYLVQWGDKGRLVFESSGSSGGFFGGCIDDVEVCKIGTTTDPDVIAPPGYTYFISASIMHHTTPTVWSPLPPLQTDVRK